MADVSLSPGTRVADCWTIIKKIGAGSFGAVYLCRDDEGMRAALKMEPIGTHSSYIRKEVNILRRLNRHRRDGRGSKHFCRCLDHGRDIQEDTKTEDEVVFDYLVMTLVGCGLNRLVRKVGGECFSPGTAIGLSIQLLSALQALHGVGYLHLDVKPGNAAIGRPQTNERRLLYLLDFGLAHRYIKDDGTPRRQRSTVGFRGSPMYAPISAHLRRDYSRRDDIESWFYVLVDLYTGSLPWCYLKGKQLIGEAKCRRMSSRPERERQRATADLLHGCPSVFGTILDHIDELEFIDRPDYEGIKRTLRTYLSSARIKKYPYDWEVMDNDESTSDANDTTTTDDDDAAVDDEYSTFVDVQNSSSSSSSTTTTTETSVSAETKRNEMSPADSTTPNEVSPEDSINEESPDDSTTPNEVSPDESTTPNEVSPDGSTNEVSPDETTNEVSPDDSTTPNQVSPDDSITPNEVLLNGSTTNDAADAQSSVTDEPDPHLSITEDDDLSRSDFLFKLSSRIVSIVMSGLDQVYSALFDAFTLFPRHFFH